MEKKDSICDVGVYYWENRWGGKTFIKTNIYGMIEWAAACSQFGQIAIKRTPGIDEIEDEYKQDDTPGINETTIDDFVTLTSCLVDSFVIVPDFIDRFLTPRRNLSDDDRKEFEEYYHNREIPEGVKEHIRKMKYSDFLTTPYWREIAKRVKTQRKRCQLCGSKKRLEVHHSDYSVHGEEIRNLDKLTILCHECHSKFHDKER